MPTVVLIQSRSSSRRLPGKALLPVGGMPAAVLCARRAANTGLDVRVATSTDASDDGLCALLEAAGIRVSRGSLDDVLARFVDALGDLPDDTVTVRLTADNLLVDGALIDEVIAAFTQRAGVYLATHPAAITGTPYGLSVEVTTAGALREAAREARDPAEREHVTIYVHRRHGRATHRPADLVGDLSYLRCTLDHWRDYQSIQGLFADVEDPVRVPWQALCGRLRDRLGAVGVPKRWSEKGEIAELALGTAQLGSPYGIANRAGQPDFATARAIVDRALRAGVSHLDCARAYGDAEARLGRILSSDLTGQVTVVTKLSPLPALRDAMPAADVRAHVASSIFESCRNLQLARLPVLLLHRWEHRHAHAGAIWAELKRLQAAGVIAQLGASIASPAEALAALDDPDIAFVQLPFNLLDRRLVDAGVPDRLRARPDVVVQARSIFLQGLLLLPAARWPALPGVDPARIVDDLATLQRELGRHSVRDLCVAYARAHAWIDGLVVGVETVAQLEDTVGLMQHPPLTEAACRRVDACFTGLPDDLLNPALWREAR